RPTPITLRVCRPLSLVLRTLSARREDRLVGLARVISDRASICYLQDVLVAPDEQRTGIGRELVRTALQPYSGVRHKVVVTDDEPAQRALLRESRISRGPRARRRIASGVRTLRCLTNGVGDAEL